MAPLPISTVQSHNGGNTAAVALLKIYYPLQRPDHPLDGQDERLSVIEISIRPESESLGARIETLSLNRINGTFRRVSAHEDEHLEKPLPVTPGVLRRSPTKEKQTSTLAPHESSSLASEESNNITMLNLSDLDKTSVAPHTIQNSFQETDARSLSIYSTDLDFEPAEWPSPPVSDISKDTDQNTNQSFNPPGIPPRSPLRESLDSPISIAYSDVSSAQWRNSQRAESLENQGSATSSSKARRQLAKVSAAAEVWRSNLRSEIAKEKLQVGKMKMKSKVPDWDFALIKMHLARLGELHVQGIEKLTEMEALFVSRLGHCWALSREFLSQQKMIWKTGCVLY